MERKAMEPKENEENIQVGDVWEGLDGFDWEIIPDKNEKVKIKVKISEVDKSILCTLLERNGKKVEREYEDNAYYPVVLHDNKETAMFSGGKFWVAGAGEPREEHVFGWIGPKLPDSLWEEK